MRGRGREREGGGGGGCQTHSQTHKYTVRHTVSERDEKGMPSVCSESNSIDLPNVVSLVTGEKHLAKFN